MELGPIPGIRQISPVDAPATEREVPPPFAPDRVGRMGDDDYREHGNEAESELIDDGSEASEQDQVDTEQDSGATERKINLIA